MESTITVTPAALPDVLLHLAVVRPVFVWGQEPFSTPRSWHMLSDALHPFGDDLAAEVLAVLA